MMLLRGGPPPFDYEKGTEEHSQGVHLRRGSWSSKEEGSNCPSITVGRGGIFFWRIGKERIFGGAEEEKKGI